MNNSILVIDDFYSDPHQVRDHALSLSFDIHGNYPGLRTRPLLHSGIFDAIQRAVQRPISYWPTDTYNGAFQITTKNDRTWVHSDHTTNYAGVLFLTPDAPLSSGTAMYRHNSTGACRIPADAEQQKACAADAQDQSKWTRSDYVANFFNRLVLFDSTRFHAGEGYFGRDLGDGRLFQTFFFSTS